MTNHRKKVSESVARPTRTAIQGTPAYLITLLIDTFYNLTDYQFGLVALILTGLVCFIQTEIENHTGKGILRSVPPTQSPVVDQ